MSSSHHSPTSNDSEPKQSLFIIRHGDRWDYQHPAWRKTAERPGDPSLSTLGHRQARSTGSFLDSLFSKDGINARNIKLLSSPFLRCVQTSNEIISELKSTSGNAPDTLHIQPEYCIFECDFLSGDWHSSLPQMSERKCYFPRLDETYQSIFVPPLPETRETFLSRCDKTMKELNKAHTYRPNSVIIIVTHAACCIGITKSATGLKLDEINAAAPCGIFKLVRSANVETWNIDRYDVKEGMNGYVDHLDDIGDKTIPWNHFGPRNDGGDGYTGPIK